MAKPLANGYPIGAVLMRDAVSETMTAGTNVPIISYDGLPIVTRDVLGQARMERHLEGRLLHAPSDSMS